VEQNVEGSSRGLVQGLGRQVEVRPHFISQEEERAFLEELEPGLKRKRYQFDHWDDAIHGYRETERGTWGSVCEGLLRRVKSVAFPEGSPLLGPVHVLDLDKAGYIKPHIDSVKFCGSTIAGLSLLSDSVMRLVKEDDADQWLDVLLPRYSLYILSGATYQRGLSAHPCVRMTDHELGEGDDNEVYRVSPTTPTPPRRSPRVDDHCHRCGEVGHFARDCLAAAPKPRSLPRS
ncbi:hypothetical protein NHX12_032414, partial [Muraenolepis orangiensis]